MALVNPSIAMSVKPIDFGDPLETYGNFAKLQAAQNQNALAQYQLSAHQRADEQATRRMNALGAAGTDPKAIANALLQSGDVKGYQDFLKSQQEVSKAAMEEKVKNLEYSSKMAEQASRIYNTVKDEASWQAAKQKLVALGGDASTLPATYDPNFVKSEVALGMSVKDQWDRVKPSPKQVNVNNRIMWIDDNPNSLSFGKEVMPSQEVGVSPNTRFTQEQENIRAAANRKAAMERVIKAQEGGQLDPEAIDFLADQVNAGDTSVLSGLARSKGAVAAVRNRATQKARESGVSPADVTAARVNLAGDLAGSRTLGTTLANVSAASSEAEKMIGIAESYVPKMNPTNYPTINAAGNYVAKQTGDPVQAGFATSLNSLVNAYARAINPKGVATVSDKNHAREIVNAAMSSGQLAEVFGVMRQEMQAARAAPKEVRAKMAGKEAPATPSARPDGVGADWSMMVDAAGNRAWVSPDKKSFKEVK